MYNFTRFSRIFPCIGCLFLGLLLSSALFSMDSNQIFQLKNKISSQKKLLNKFYDPKKNEKLSYLDYLDKLLEKKEFSFLFSCFSKEIFNRYNINIPDLFYQNFGKNLDKGYFDKKIYISAVKTGSKNLIVIQLPVPEQRGLQCSSNAFRYSTLLAKTSVWDCLFKPLVWSKRKNKNIITDYVREVGEGRSAKKLNGGFSTKVGISRLYRSYVDIYNLSFLRMNTQKQIKVRIEQETRKSYKEDPRIRFSVSGQPEIFYGGIKSSERSIGHDIAWRLEYLGNIKHLGDTYAILFSDSFYKSNKINAYKDKFIAFLDTMVMDQKTVFKYSNH